jgi:hypothetical protein
MKRNQHEFMKPKAQTIRITLCAPGDVGKELAIISGEIEEWNLLHWDATNCGIKCLHWRSDAAPDLSDRPQAVINKQLIDESAAIIAVFWSRFGSPTGIADSGTEEEVLRAMALGKRVLLYFSDLEPLPTGVDESQLAKLQRFRTKMLQQGLAFSFRSRPELRSLVRTHLAKFMHEKVSMNPSRKPRPTSSQGGVSLVGNGNFQVVGDGNKVYQRPPVIRQVTPLPEGSITAAEQQQVAQWIESLVENTSGITRGEAYSSWWSRLKKKFKVEKYECIRSTSMPEIQAWYQQQMAILKSKRRTSAPDTWRRDRITAIKAAMGKMRRSNEDYYPELSERLNLKRPFVSLTKVTKTDLDRIYRMVLSDAKKRG